MSLSVPLLCFNDVYRVRQRFVPQPGSPESKYEEGAEIRVGQFAKLVEVLREQWATRIDGDKDGLVLFAGDLYSPSVESSVTRGSHMVPIMNAMKVDCACVGNHDFDFGYPHMTKLIGGQDFPWLLSNVYNVNTGESPVPLRRFAVVERCGVRIGMIGLVEEDWIATIPSWPDTFRYRQMKDVALELSKELRDPKGEHRVDIIIAITHSRVPNDLKLAQELGATSAKDTENEHGIDLVVGGHDHIYYIGKGADSWEGYVGPRDQPVARDDVNARLVKSGTDFRDLSEVNVELSPPNENAVRRRVITKLTGKHHYVLPSSPSSPEVDHLVKRLLASVTTTLSQPVCFTLTPFDARSEEVRTRETGLGNWVADVLMHAYDESLVDGNRVEFEKENSNELQKAEDAGGADAVIVCGGTLRGDSQYGPGKITLGDILEIFPFDDPVVCLEIDGKGIWDTLESSLSKWPAQEGRFPVIAGLAVDWDHRKPPGERVNSIHLTVKTREHDEIEDPDELVDFVDNQDGTRVVVKQTSPVLGEPIQRVEGGRMYRIVTRQYMADGFDGFEALKGRKMIIDHENGQTMSSILRSFLLGSAFIFRQKQLVDAHHQHLSAKTLKVLSRARQQHQTSPVSSLASSPRQATRHLDAHSAAEMDTSFASISSSTWGILRRHVVEHDWVTIREVMHVAKHEHMSSVDACLGDKLRNQRAGKSADTTPGNGTPGVLEEVKGLGEELAIVCPLVDGRLKDQGETATGEAS